jgi:Domain of unknown function (DUF3883)
MKTKKKSKLTNDSSRQIDEHLHRISYREIKILWGILGNLSLTKEDLVQKRFLQTGVQYSDVSDFLNGLGLVRKSKGCIRRNTVSDETDDAIKIAIIERLLNRTTPYRILLNEFLGHFKNMNGRFEITMNSERRGRFGGIRNLLLELEFLDHDLDKPRYWVSPQYLTAFLDAKSVSASSPLDFQAILCAREKLGCEAELEIVKYETARLKNHPPLAKRIKHVAAENVSAGYDILSFTETKNVTGISDRLIEVKAVSPLDFKFFWSRNEIETARLHGQNYYLYLVPVSKTGFDLGKIKIIQNPFHQVYMNDDSWHRQDEIVSFWQKQSAPSKTEIEGNL